MANHLQFAVAHKRYGRVLVRIVSGVCKPNAAYSLEGQSQVVKLQQRESYHRLCLLYGETPRYGTFCVTVKRKFGNGHHGFADDSIPFRESISRARWGDCDRRRASASTDRCLVSSDVLWDATTSLVAIHDSPTDLAPTKRRMRGLLSVINSLSPSTSLKYCSFETSAIANTLTLSMCGSSHTIIAKLQKLTFLRTGVPKLCFADRLKTRPAPWRRVCVGDTLSRPARRHQGTFPSFAGLSHWKAHHPSFPRKRESRGRISQWKGARLGEFPGFRPPLEQPAPAKAGDGFALGGTGNSKCDCPAFICSICPCYGFIPYHGF